MSERAAYSRVYWSIIDDPKFVTIYDDDHHLAAWMRLLLIADQAHPASAHLPANVRRASVRALSEAGLVDVCAGRYRIHGLDAERERRRVAATSRPPKRDPNGDRTVPDRFPDTGPKTRRDETSLDETRQDDGRADLEAFCLVTRRAPTPRQRQLLDDILERHDVSGPQWAADIMLAHPDNPIGAVIEADKAYRVERIAEARSAERKPRPDPRPKMARPESIGEALAGIPFEQLVPRVARS